MSKPVKASEFDLIPAVLPAKQLRENTIETLNLSNKGLGVDGGLMLAALMAGNSSTQYLHVFGNSFGQAGGEAMAEALKTNKTLEEIHVGNLMVGCTVRLKSSGEEKVVIKHPGCHRPQQLSLARTRPRHRPSGLRWSRNRQLDCRCALRNHFRSHHPHDWMHPRPVLLIRLLGELFAGSAGSQI